ncbi:MAG: hypothetical protein GOP50_13295 [Candidatus Heimdallarchaeota archaeon]|nr:hypothetical protein [Candidatus Heimdallarchaeota archaeon]
MIKLTKKFKTLSIIILILFPMLFFANNLEMEFVQAESEPNDSFATADTITTSGDDMAGTVRWQSGDFFDYYKVNCAAGTTLTVDKNYVDPDDGFSVFYVDIYNPSQSKIAGYANLVLESITTSVSGYHYLRVSSDAPGTASYSYEITFTAGPPAPSLTWVSPTSGEIVFGPSPDADHALFNISYTSANLDSVELWIGGTNRGTLSSSPDTVTFAYDGTTNGEVTCTLKGYQGTSVVIEKSRSFTFKKLLSTALTLITEDVQSLGRKLYSILYDPSGDLSSSGWEESSTMSLLVGSTLGMTFGVEVSAEFDFLLFSGGASFGIELTTEVGYEFRYEITDFLEIHSVETENDDPDYMGPGRGDTYWGETWLIPWKLYAQNNSYWGDEYEYDDAVIKYGIQRSATSLLTDSDAPEEWRSQNLVHLGYPEELIEWFDNSSISGGIGDAQTVSQEITTTVQQSQSIELNIDASVSIEVWGVETTLSLGLNTQVYKETSEAHSVKKTYTIGDDDPDDHLYHRIGVDKRFGTYVFKTEVGTNTSSPHEFDTINYVKPEVQSYDILYDTSGDGLGPCENDEPQITAIIEDDGYVTAARLYYAYNGGGWDYVSMNRSVFDDSEWIGFLPGYEHGIEVSWYIEATDNYGLILVYKDPLGDPFSYTIINRAPVVEITFPTGSENITVDLLYIYWDAYDLDDDSLTYDVSYNIYNTGWHLLAEDITDSYYVWDISALEFSDSVQIKVIADDGHGGVTEAVTPYVFSIGTLDESGIGLPVALILSFLSLATLAVFLKKRRKI